MKFNTLAGAAAAIALFSLSQAAHAEDTDPPGDITITGTAAIVSQYKLRGLAQSDNKPVVQATLTVSHSSGFYLSTWGGSASAGTSPINIGGSEIDVMGGYTRTLDGSGITLDAGAVGYIYPGAPNGNFFELYGSLAKTLGPVTAKAGIFYAPGQRVFDFNFTSPSRHNAYVYGDLSSGIPGTPITLHAHLGHTGGGFEWGRQYLDYSAGASYKWKSLTFDISVAGTNVSKSNINADFGCLGAVACIDSYHRMSKTVAIASLTASF